VITEIIATLAIVMVRGMSVKTPRHPATQGGTVRARNANPAKDRTNGAMAAAIHSGRRNNSHGRHRSRP
jgi:hypothetical protein